MKQALSEPRIRASYHRPPSPAMAAAGACILRAGWLDAAPGGGIRRETCPGDDVLYCVSGHGRIDVCGRRFAVAPGEMAWIAGDGPHGHVADSKSPWSVMWFRMQTPDTPALRRRLLMSDTPVIAVGEAAQLVAWFENLFDTMAAPGDDIDLRLNAAVGEFLMLVGRQQRPGALAQSPAGFDRLRRAIRANPQQRWSAADMEVTAGLSASQLRRLFRRHMATTPRGYLRRERISRAQFMMLDTTTPIGEVAIACGFSDPYHFSRDFARVVGTSPSAWRRAERQI